MCAANKSLKDDAPRFRKGTLFVPLARSILQAFWLMVFSSLFLFCLLSPIKRLRDMETICTNRPDFYRATRFECLFRMGMTKCSPLSLLCIFRRRFQHHHLCQLCIDCPTSTDETPPTYSVAFSNLSFEIIERGAVSYFLYVWCGGFAPLDGHCIQRGKSNRPATIPEHLFDGGAIFIWAIPASMVAPFLAPSTPQFVRLM